MAVFPFQTDVCPELLTFVLCTIFPSHLSERKLHIVFLWIPPVHVDLFLIPALNCYGFKKIRTFVVVWVIFREGMVHFFFFLSGPVIVHKTPSIIISH